MQLEDIAKKFKYMSFDAILEGANGTPVNEQSFSFPREEEIKDTEKSEEENQDSKVISIESKTEAVFNQTVQQENLNTEPTDTDTNKQTITIQVTEVNSSNPVILFHKKNPNITRSKSFGEENLSIPKNKFLKVSPGHHSDTEVNTLRNRKTVQTNQKSKNPGLNIIVSKDVSQIKTSDANFKIFNEKINKNEIPTKNIKSKKTERIGCCKIVRAVAIALLATSIALMVFQTFANSKKEPKGFFGY